MRNPSTIAANIASSRTNRVVERPRAAASATSRSFAARSIATVVGSSIRRAKPSKNPVIDSAEHADNLYEVMAERVGQALSDQARASLSARNDGQLMASWMVRVLLQDQA